MYLLRSEVPLFIALMITWVSGQDCGNTHLTDNHGILTSPNYPRKYEHRSDCLWTITAPENHFVELRFDDFDVKNPFWECHYDYVTVIYDDVRNETFCNHHEPEEKRSKRSTLNVLKIHLKSDHFFLNGRGFKATYDVVDDHGNKLVEEEEEEEQPEEETVAASTTTTSTTMTTTTTKPTTKIKSTTTTTKPTTTSKSTTTSTLISKIKTKFAQTEKKESTTSSGNVDDGNEGINSNPGAMSGLVIAAIVGIVLVVLSAIFLYAFIRYRRNKNKRIHLNVVATSDAKELISNKKIYKKVPEDEETFPL